ncbi:hypothetical protein RHOSPDRAFT_23986 [Rhodotorula sp. JG-1b]|nr:hypothetical protein RHOSPDRAFT_23986 [Rhodotorula sp. JG-1b]
MVSKDWMNVGQSFATPPVASTSRATPNESYSTSRYRGPEQATSAPRTTQARLFSLDKAPLVTPRASASAPRPTQKQATLDAFTSQTSTARGKKPMRKSSLGPRERGTILGQLDSPRRPVSSLARRDSARTELHVFRDDEELVTEEAEEKPVVGTSNSWFKSIFGRDDAPAVKGASTPSRAPVSSSSSFSKGKSRNIGRDILSKPARRGPTIEFDRDLETDLSYSQEMLGEQERKKRRRIEGSGPAQWGKLEMCDAEDHDGFGSPHREQKNRQSAKASRPSVSGRGAGHRGPVINLGSESSDGGEAELEADLKPLVARSQRQLDPHPRRLVPPSPRAPSPRKRSRQTPPASPAWLAPPTPSPSSSGSSARSTAAALQAQLVPPRREFSDRLEEERHESSSRPAKTAEPAVLVPNSDPPEPSLEDLDSGPEPSTLDSSSGSNETAAETTPRRAPPPPAASAPITAKRRGDESGFSEGGVLMTSDDATPRPPPATAAAAALNSTRLDLTGLPTSSPTVLPLRRTLRPNPDVAAADDDEEEVGTSAQLGRTASGVLMPPPPLPVSPQKRLSRLRKGAPSTRAASLADKEAAAAAVASSAVDEDRSPPETILEGTQYLLPDGRSGLGDDPILVTDSYPFLFAPVPRPNPAKGYTPIRFGDQDDARLPTPHAKESPLTHKVPLLQPTTSSPIRAPVEAQDARVGPVVSSVIPAKVATSVPAMGVPTAAAGWASSVAPAWEGARPPSPNAPRQSRLGEFFTTVPSSQAHADGREEEDDETQLVEDSQQMATGMAAEETALLKAVMQLRPRMNEMRAATTTTTPDRKGPSGTAVVTNNMDDIVKEHEVDEQQIQSPSKPTTPVKSDRPSRASPSPSPSAYVEDSDPEGDALASPLVAGVLRSTSTSPTKPTAKERRRRSGGRLDGPVSVPRYSPTKIKRAAVERQARQRHTTTAATEEEQPAAEGAATDETQWESYWSYPSEPVAGPSGAGATPAEGILDCSPRKLAELIAKVKALPPDLPPDWAVDEDGELYRLDEDRWDPDQYPITESLLHVLE